MTANSTIMAAAAEKAKARAEAKPAKDVPAIKSMLPRYADAIKAALPAVMTPERFLRIAASALSANPALLETTPESFFGALMTAAQLGLEPNTPLGQAYLIPYENTKLVEGKWVKVKETQFQLGYKGAIALAYRSGEVSGIQAEEVCENDTFEYEMGLEPKLRHIPARTNRGKPTHYYAVWKTKTGTTGFAVMSVEDVQDIAKRSSKTFGKERSPWTRDFAEMAKKTVLKRALKYAPVASDFARAAESDEAVRDYNKDILALDTPVRHAQIEDATPAPDASPAAQEAPSAPSDAQTPPTTR